VRQWLESLAQFEALCSLASLAHDNPDWNFPEITTADPPRSFEAQQLAHPLLSASSRVANDVALEGSGTFLLVTGSNMSGKSTLLRTIGTNAVLAQAGAPICGQSLRMPPLVIETSMRIQDSLEDGVSFFMAELKRLKEVVDSARALDLNPSRCLLYLLDEILQGTNSAERQIAVRRVIGHLLAHGAIGAISTHDLELANEPPLDSAARRVHFRETITEQATGRGMTFDYRLREGIATTTNALALLDLVGLTHEEEDA
jgi:DNA mismatch repair ATPase MutS